jgi:hypothetical protein
MPESLAPSFVVADTPPNSSRLEKWMSLISGELRLFLFPVVSRLEFWKPGTRGSMLGTLPASKLYWLPSIMPYYNMAVKSARAGAFRKSLGNFDLGDLQECGGNAISAGFEGGRRLSREAFLKCHFDATYSSITKMWYVCGQRSRRVTDGASGQDYFFGRAGIFR